MLDTVLLNTSSTDLNYYPSLNTDDNISPWTRPFNYGCLFGFNLAIFGVIGNTLCFHTAGYLPASTSAYLMRYLAVWDTLAATQDGIFNLGLRFFDINLADYDTWGCKIFHYHSWGSSTTANYHILAMAVDRVVAIKAPFWHRSHSSIHLARKISLACFVFSYTLVIPNLYFFDIAENEDICSMHPKTYPLVLKIYMIIANYISYFAIPFLLLISINIFFVYNLRKRGIWTDKAKEQQTKEINMQLDIKIGSENNKSSVVNGTENDMKMSAIGTSKLKLGPENALKESTVDNLMVPVINMQSQNLNNCNKIGINSGSLNESSGIGNDCNSVISISNINQTYTRKAQCDRNYILILLSVTCSFMVLALAVAVINTAAISSTANSNHPHDQTKVNFFLILAEIPAIMNNCLNFIFYLTSSRMFRSAFRKAYGPHLERLRLKKPSKDGHSLPLSQSEGAVRKPSHSSKSLPNSKMGSQFVDNNPNGPDLDV